METPDDDRETSTKTTKPFLLGLDPEDRELLDRVATAEKLTRADILRIALRRYAKEKGLENKPAA